MNPSDLVTIKMSGGGATAYAVAPLFRITPHSRQLVAESEKFDTVLPTISKEEVEKKLNDLIKRLRRDLRRTWADARVELVPEEDAVQALQGVQERGVVFDPFTGDVSIVTTTDGCQPHPLMMEGEEKEAAKATCWTPPGTPNVKIAINYSSESEGVYACWAPVIEGEMKEQPGWENIITTTLPNVSVDGLLCEGNVAFFALRRRVSRLLGGAAIIPQSPEGVAMPYLFAAPDDMYMPYPSSMYVEELGGPPDASVRSFIFKEDGSQFTADGCWGWARFTHPIRWFGKEYLHRWRCLDSIHGTNSGRGFCMNGLVRGVEGEIRSVYLKSKPPRPDGMETKRQIVLSPGVTIRGALEAPDGSLYTRFNDNPLSPAEIEDLSDGQNSILPAYICSSRAMQAVNASRVSSWVLFEPHWQELDDFCIEHGGAYLFQGLHPQPKSFGQIFRSLAEHKVIATPLAHGFKPEIRGSQDALLVKVDREWLIPATISFFSFVNASLTGTGWDMAKAHPSLMGPAFPMAPLKPSFVNMLKEQTDCPLPDVEQQEEFLKQFKGWEIIPESHLIAAETLAPSMQQIETRMVTNVNQLMLPESGQLFIVYAE